MSRTTFGALTLFVNAPAATASAQGPSIPPILPITAPIRDAGTLHLADRTWTRTSSVASLGADILYNNMGNPR